MRIFTIRYYSKLVKILIIRPSELLIDNEYNYQQFIAFYLKAHRL